jgi:gas vesicle protein
MAKKKPKIRVVHKLYVDTDNGRVLHAPNTVDGETLFRIPDRYFEITEEQAKRILEKGEPWAVVIKSGLEERITKKVEEMVSTKLGEVEEKVAEAEEDAAPETAPVEDEKKAPAKKAPAKKAPVKKADK